MNLPVNQTRCNNPDSPDHPCLQDCIARYASAIPGLANLGKQLQGLSPSVDADALIDLYEQCYMRKANPRNRMHMKGLHA